MLAWHCHHATFSLISHIGAWPYFDDVEKGIAFEPTTAHRSPNQNLLAVGDKAGAVKIYNYPCLAKQVSEAKNQCALYWLTNAVIFRLKTLLNYLMRKMLPKLGLLVMGGTF